MDDILSVFPLCRQHAEHGNVYACESLEAGHRTIKPAEVNMWINQMVHLFFCFNIICCRNFLLAVVYVCAMTFYSIAFQVLCQV